MTNPPSEDCAWVSIPTPFDRDELRRWLEQPEALYRVNSLLEITGWRRENAQRTYLQGRNLSNGLTLDLGLELSPDTDSLRVDYEQGLKRATLFAVEPAEQGGFQLRITDDYSGWSEPERESRLAEVDRSLPQWGQDLHRFFRAWHRWSRFPPWRWYMTRIWLRMKPSARRITRWVIWIGIAELVAFLVVFAVFVVERG